MSSFSFLPGRQPNDLFEAVRRLYRKQAFSSLQKILPKIYPSDLAQILDAFEEDDALKLFMLIAAPETAARTLTELAPDLQAYILEQGDYDRMLKILEQLPPDDRTDILRQLPPAAAKRFMGGMDRAILREVEDLLQYSSDTAGGIMTSQFFAMPESATVQEAIDAVRKLPTYEMVFYLYVLEENERLVGVSSLRQLILADPEKTLGQIMNPRAVRVATDTPRAEIGDLVKRYRLLALPVVDDMDVLVGIVTVDDVIDAIEEEVSDDMLRMAGTHSAEEFVSESFFRTFWGRLPWLIAALIGGLVASGIIDYYFHRVLGESVLANADPEEVLLALVLALTAFLPMVMSVASSVGTVSATVTVHGLATGSIKPANTLPLLAKELGTGVLLGTCYGAITALAAWWLFDDILAGNLISKIVGITVWFNISVASLLGPGLPLLFQWLRREPTSVTGPYLGSLLDVLAVLNYFVIAELLLPA
jgi:magnesium transporter